MADTVIEFPRTGKSRDVTSSSEHFFNRRGTGVTSWAAPIDVAGTSATGNVVRLIEIDKLYPNTGGSTAEVVRALGLLADANVRLERARLCAESSPLSADRELQHFQSLLPALFSCRRIGDGFALVVNSLQNVFINLQGKLLSKVQISTIWRILREVRSKPYLSFDQSLELVAELEDVNLEVDPQILASLIEDE
jgi:hypothetical protein